MKSTGIWIADIVSNFRLHIVVISVISALFVVFIFASTYALFLLLPLLYALLPFKSWQARNLATISHNTKTYSICSFNIEWNAKQHTRSLKYIENSAADIMVLQEVPESLKENIHQLRSNFPYQYGEGHSHVMVLCKHELEFIEFLPWPGKFKQRALHVICKLNGQDLHVFAIHLQVTRSWNQITIRDKQVSTLFESIAKVDGAILLVGDFNAATASNVLRRIETNTQLYSEESLLAYKHTWPAKMGVLGVQLDHIYANDNIILSDLQLGPVLDSDHRPISSKFKFL